MQIFDLAYKAKVKERQIQKISDDNGSIAYNIWKLKSSSNLGSQLLAKDSVLQFASGHNIIELATYQSPIQITD